MQSAAYSLHGVIKSARPDCSSTFTLQKVAKSRVR